MHVASSVPKQHVTSGNGIDIVAKIPVRPKMIFSSEGKLSTIWRALLEVTTTSVTALVAAVVLTYEMTVWPG